MMAKKPITGQNTPRDGMDAAGLTEPITIAIVDSHVVIPDHFPLVGDPKIIQETLGIRHVSDGQQRYRCLYIQSRVDGLVT